jgi:hypothetical protein
VAGGKEFSLFVEEFAKTIEDQAIMERKKYPETYERPQDSKVVLDKAVAK